MSEYQYIPIEETQITNNLSFPVQIEKKTDNQWIAWIKNLPGCASWGHTKKEALKNLKAIIQRYFDAFLK